MHRINTKDWAKYWGVSIRTIQNWVKSGHPVSDVLAMARLIISKRLGGKNALSKAHEVMLEHDKRIPAGEAAPKNDASDISSLGREREGPGLEAFEDEVVDLDRAGKYFWGKMKEAARVGNSASETYYHDRWLKNEKAKRDSELHAKKMGLDEGLIISREEFARMVIAFAFWSVRSVELDLKHLSALCVDLPNQEVAWGVLDRHFMRKRFLAAFEKAATCKAGVSLPKWCMAELRRAVDMFFEVDTADEDDVTAYAAFEAAVGLNGGGDA